MKKIMIIFLVPFFTTVFCQAQTKNVKREPHELTPFKVAVGLGYAVPGAGDGAGGGVLFFVEPAYRPVPQVSVGLRLESALMARGIQGINDSDVSGEASAAMSYTLNGQYYFNQNYIRPFVGAGVGLFSLASSKFDTSSDNNVEAHDVAAETRFGFYPRVGVDVGHLNLTVDYNFVPSTEIPDGGEVKNNYLGVRVGFSIGGGAGAKVSE